MLPSCFRSASEAHNRETEHWHEPRTAARLRALTTQLASATKRKSPGENSPGVWNHSVAPKRALNSLVPSIVPSALKSYGDAPSGPEVGRAARIERLCSSAWRPRTLTGRILGGPYFHPDGPAAIIPPSGRGPSMHGTTRTRGARQHRLGRNATHRGPRRRPPTPRQARQSSAHEEVNSPTHSTPKSGSRFMGAQSI